LAVNTFVAPSINGNRGTQQEFSASIKVANEIVPIQQARVRIPNLGVIGVAEGGKRAMPPTFLAYLVILRSGVPNNNTVAFHFLLFV